MALLGGFRTDQLIGQLVSESDTNSPAAQKTIERLKKIGPKVIPKIIDALAMSDKHHTMVFVDILASHVNDKTLKFYQEGLADGGDRVVTGTAWALSSSNNYNANALLDFLDDPEVSKPALIEVLKVHKNNLSVHDVLQRAYKMEPKEKAALFAIIEDVVSVDMVPDLINRMGGKDPAIKIHIMRLLSKFNKDEINRAFEMQLGDSNKLVRSAALCAIGKDTSPSNELRSCCSTRTWKYKTRRSMSFARLMIRKRSNFSYPHSKTSPNIRAALPSKCSMKYAIPSQSRICWQPLKMTTGGYAPGPVTRWQKSADQKSSTRYSNWSRTMTRKFAAQPSRS